MRQQQRIMNLFGGNFLSLLKAYDDLEGAVISLYNNNVCFFYALTDTFDTRMSHDTGWLPLVGSLKL